MNDIPDTVKDREWMDHLLWIRHAPFCSTANINDGRYLPKDVAQGSEGGRQAGQNNSEFYQTRLPNIALHLTAVSILAICSKRIIVGMSCICTMLPRTQLLKDDVNKSNSFSLLFVL